MTHIYTISKTLRSPLFKLLMILQISSSCKMLICKLDKPLWNHVSLSDSLTNWGSFLAERSLPQFDLAVLYMPLSLPNFRVGQMDCSFPCHLSNASFTRSVYGLSKVLFLSVISRIMSFCFSLLFWVKWWRQ